VELAALILAQRSTVTIDLSLEGLVALGAGILILVVPKSLNYIVAAYLIFVGLVDIFDIRL
jgi:hypothetical protein